MAQRQAIQVADRQQPAVPLLFLKIWWERSRVGSIPTLGTNHFLANQALATFRDFSRKMSCGNFSKSPEYFLVFTGTNLAHGDDTGLL
jgi:hypothetical protein